MSGRWTYLVCYDICDPKRLRRVYKILRGFGDHWQYSVFRCVLSDARKVRLMTRLDQIIHHGEDQVLIAPLGPAGGQNESNIQTIGKRLEPAEKSAKVL
ncbi:MAG TPA: CRISPR-associated endonuclease Cas2 [Myxococcales bacterium LLY-WYZ-16_1]|jgi:CRISPR-associated protein Cas2|nr:CRISPR-associated endonuclease Cas2 [Myxococcales bacterium LLY-WYZ-16_1]